MFPTNVVDSCCRCFCCCWCWWWCCCCPALQLFFMQSAAALRRTDPTLHTSKRPRVALFCFVHFLLFSPYTFCCVFIFCLFAISFSLVAAHSYGHDFGFRLCALRFSLALFSPQPGNCFPSLPPLYPLPILLHPLLHRLQVSVCVLWASVCLCARGSWKFSKLIRII